MTSTHEVHCCICNKKLAWWSMYDNIQHEDEWECNNTKLRRKISERRRVYRTKKNGERIYYKYEYLDCSSRYVNNSVYCGKCAKKLKFKCKNCRTGKIKLSRKK